MTETLPNTEFQQMVPLMREKEFYEPEPQRPIIWSAYTLAQINEVKLTLTFIREKVDATNYLPMPGKVGRPLTDPKILAKAILLAEFLSSPERPSQGWSSILGPAVGIFQELDDRVIGEAYNNVEVVYILKQVFDNNKTSDGRLSGDGTYLEMSRKHNYATTKKQYGVGLASIVDSREVVQEFRTHEHELRAMREMVKTVHGNSIRLDAGFNDRELVDQMHELGLTTFVFPKKNNVLNGHLAWKLMYLELYLDVMSWLTEYHQRSHAESFHSSFKRQNVLVRKHRPTGQLSQITARIILHNRQRIDYFSRQV